MTEFSAINPDRTLDTVGLFCPVPIIKTAKLVKEMRSGEVLLVLSDDCTHLDQRRLAPELPAHLARVVKHIQRPIGRREE